jgi:PAS domain S-box-containing protein
MAPLLRIVHLEDNADDAFLVEAALKAEGIAFEMEVVSTRERFLAALEGPAIDLILSDFSLPSFNGIEALKIVNERRPDIPFILVSGTMGEDAAIESLRGGATDYVLKGRLSRLGPAARRALAESEDRKRRRQAEATLREERQFLKVLLESLEDGIVACDAAGALTLFNRRAREFHGLQAEPIPEQDWAQRFGLFHTDGVTPMKREEIPLFRALQGEQVRGVEMKIVPREGEARQIVASGQPITDEDGRKIGAVIAMHDVTNRKQLEAQLRQAQKMEAIGRLAGGVAHDFNNLLSVIGGYSELLLNEIGPDEALRGMIEQIRQAGDRAASLTRQLLAFSRKQVVTPQVLDLGVILAGVDKMLRRLIGEDIELIARHHEGLGHLMADPGQIEQILMNLVVNARDAMPQGGRLTIETADVDIKEPFVRLHPGSRAGRQVMMSVTDTGTGMSAETMSKIFEPFFTTKEEGKGTGLGLATVYGIVKQSEGYIGVESDPGHGTTFRIYWPRIDTPAAKPGETRRALSLSGKEAVLVVEDDATYRALIVEALQGWGYRVFAAADARRAIEVLEGAEGTVDLLLTDVILADMNGFDLAKRAALMRPALKIICMSGHTDHPAIRSHASSNANAFLQKPFALTTLAGKIREALRGVEAGAAPSS